MKSRSRSRLAALCATPGSPYCQTLAALLISIATGSFYTRSIALEGMYFLLDLVLFAQAFFSCQLIRNNTVKFEDFLVINNWESLILQWVTLLLIALTARTLTQEEGV